MRLFESRFYCSFKGKVILLKTVKIYYLIKERKYLTLTKEENAE